MYVFKKRPNFLNSAPTSTESALRLLSTPSVRFCLQTAICLVSLWALVIELHPLNCARAQAVCLFSDKVTMKELEEQRVLVKVLCKLGTGFMGMMLKPRCNRRSGCRKGLLDPPKKGRMCRSKIKVLLVVFFDWKGIVHHEFVPRDQMVNKELYQEVLSRLRDAVRRKRPELWENKLGCCTTTMR